MHGHGRSRLCLSSTHEPDEASNKYRAEEEEHRPRQVAKQRHPQRWRSDVDTHLLFPQFCYQRRVAEVRDSAAEGISLCCASRDRAVHSTLEASIDFRSLERDACDVPGFELIKKCTVRHWGRFDGLCKDHHDEQDKLLCLCSGDLSYS